MLAPFLGFVGFDDTAPLLASESMLRRYKAHRAGLGIRFAYQACEDAPLVRDVFRIGADCQNTICAIPVATLRRCDRYPSLRPVDGAARWRSRRATLAARLLRFDVKLNHHLVAHDSPSSNYNRNSGVRGRSAPSNRVRKAPSNR